MQAYEEFKDMKPDFWAFVKFVSEMLGYSVKNTGVVRTYSAKEISDLCHSKNTNVNHVMIEKAVRYFEMRAKSLNDQVQYYLMDAETASAEFLKLQGLYKDENYSCKLPLNKQKGDMKQVAYFTAIINILAEKTIKKNKATSHGLGFDDDPRRLVYIWDEEKNLIGASSRRFDGAYPDIISPKIVWEIKEYYYATTFGSRVADGVYETQLDGFEFKEIFDRTGHKVFHILFIDAYRTWWVQGRSYLCRVIDALNYGLVDEVIFGKEVLIRWPELLKSLL